MATTTVVCVADAVIREPTFGAGKNDHLAAAFEGGNIFRSLLRFTMPDWTALNVRRITSAVLLLENSQQFMVTRGGTPKVIINRVTAPWSEGTSTGLASTSSIRWDNQPSTTTDDEVTSATLPTADAANVSIGITALVRAWAPASVENGLAKPNYGIRIRSFNEASSANDAEFLSREVSGAERRPRILITFEDNFPPEAPVALTPTTADNGDATPALFVEPAERLSGTTYLTGRKYLRFGGTQIDTDAGDYATKAEVQVYADTATDAVPGTVLLTSIATVSGIRSDVLFDVDATTLTVGTIYRARLRTADRKGAWGAWSSLDDMRFTPDTRPVLTNPAVDPAAVRPNFYGSISDPDPGAEISAARVRVFLDTSSGVVTMWDSGWDDVAGGTRFTVTYGGGSDLEVGTLYRLEMALRDDLGGESAFVTLTVRPGATTGPDAMSPIDVETKQDTRTPTLTIGHSAAFDAYELEVARFGDGSGLLWDVAPTTHASTSSKDVVYAGTALDWGKTYYWRAKVRVGGVTWSDWSPWYPFYVNALPLAPVGSIDGAVASGTGLYGAYVTIDDTTPVLRFPFSDPDRVKGYTDDPERREIEIVVASTGAGVTGSPFVITSGITDTYTPAALTNETIYKARARYDDSASQRSAWSEWLVFKVSSAPTIAAGTAVDDTDPAPIIDWTFSSPAGKAQRRFQVLVFDDATGELVHDSGLVDSASTQYQVPGELLANGMDYRATVGAYDEDLLSDELAISVWTTAFGAAPAAVTNLTATADEDGAAVVLTWDATALGDLFWRYYVYRFDPVTGELVRIAAIADEASPTFIDTEAPIGVAITYQVTVSDGFQESEPATATATLSSGGWWIVTPNDPSLTFRIRYVHGFRERFDPDQEDFAPLGRGAPLVVSGDTLPPSGSIMLEVHLEDGTVVDRLRLVQAVDPWVILKTAFGDVRRVKVGAVDVDRAGLAGIRNVSFDYRTVVAL